MRSAAGVYRVDARRGSWAPRMAEPGTADRPARRGPPRRPRSTYRLQFSKDFRFADATAIVPYLAALGISHVYASPLLMARPGSTHGYDIVDHNRLNPEIGDEHDFDRFVAALHRHRMGLILDFVPNHMAIGPDNAWWMDVLEWGQRSPHAGFFDIDWEPVEPTLRGKVLLPVLGDHYGAVLERGELRLALDAEHGTFAVDYMGNRFPIAPTDYPAIIGPAVARSLDPVLDALRRLGDEPGRAACHARAAEAKAGLAAAVANDAEAAAALRAALDGWNGTVGQRGSFDRLHDLLERQAYRLAYWRVAAQEINYRRFFDINDLAGLRMEDPALFEASHRLIRRMIADGKLQGLRLDHVDGLRDPRGYFARLQEILPPPLRLAAGADDGPQRQRAPVFPILVEKILAQHESLRRDWAVTGTTGYEFMAEVNGLFVNADGAAGMTRAYERFVERTTDFEEIVDQAKRLIMRETLASELTVLANAFSRLAKKDRSTRDYALIGLRQALIEVAAAFPVYRTYLTEVGAADEDRRALDWAVGRARRNATMPDRSVFDFIYDVLTLDLLKRTEGSYGRAELIDAALKFQQYTGPLMAKAMEDTAFYRYVRMASLNDVGGDPARFGVSTAAFHETNRRRLRDHPFSLLATATHDHKRGEDVRARLAVLSEIPREWSRQARRWRRLNQRKRREIDGRPAPSRNDEYLFYQIIVGAWPYEMGAPDFDGIDVFRERIRDYMLKAAREAKLRTGWAAPDEDYEAALTQFIDRVLDPAQSRPVLEIVAAFVDRIAAAGAVNGLAQTLLKLTSPGIPDVYQGAELWDLSLVDPDNRRPVDYRGRADALQRAAGDGMAEELLAVWRDGRVKQFVVHRALMLRRRAPALFATGGYEPLAVSGVRADNIVAFARSAHRRLAIAVAPRLVLPLLNDADRPMPRSWDDTAVALTPNGGRFSDNLTGQSFDSGDGSLPVARLLERFPVALLVSG
jgi:(1->4)-alpha-D-glucan 1-alpha-D-glucosylmutase